MINFLNLFPGFTSTIIQEKVGLKKFYGLDLPSSWFQEPWESSEKARVAHDCFVEQPLTLCLRV